ERGFGGAGTVHHVAWASTMEEHEAWRQRVAEAGARPTPVIDRFYFRSIYFREPSGVLFEIATLGPGFATDEPIEHRGERLPRRLARLARRRPPALAPRGAHWFGVPRVGYPDPATFQPASALAASWLDSLEAQTGGPLERTVLGGFSPGAVLTYALGLGQGRP